MINNAKTILFNKLNVSFKTDKKFYAEFMLKEDRKG